LINVIYLAVPVDELGKTIFFSPLFIQKLRVSVCFAENICQDRLGTNIGKLKKDPLSRRHALAGLGGGGRYASGCHAAAAWVHRGL
jgi:hypothetical protein